MKGDLLSVCVNSKPEKIFGTVHIDSFCPFRAQQFPPNFAIFGGDCGKGEGLGLPWICGWE
jgi:hypothetical protein